MDYASSGLEQPLGYFWAALFLAALRRSGRAGAKPLAALTAIASLACVTRQDTLLLYLPALVVAARRAPRRGRAAAVTAGLLPVVIWHGFSLIYYGSPVPNTAYAKLLGPSLGLGVQAAWGLRYAALSVAHDPAALVLMVASVWVARRRGDAWSAAAGRRGPVPGLHDRVRGGVDAYARALPGDAALRRRGGALRRAARPARDGGRVGGGGGRARDPSDQRAPRREPLVQRAAQWQMDVIDPRVVAAPYWIDAKWFTVREHADLMSQVTGMPVPRHDWYLDGLSFRDAPQPLQVGERSSRHRSATSGTRRGRGRSSWI